VSIQLEGMRLSLEQIAVRCHGNTLPNVLAPTDSPLSMRVKDGKGTMTYTAAMALTLFRLLAAISLVLMPLGMANASGPKMASDGTEMSHCDEHREPVKAPGATDRHCAACLALPTPAGRFAIAELQPPAPASASPAEPLLSQAPDVATPPPKTA